MTAAESAYWDAHTERSEQYGGDWEDEHDLVLVERGLALTIDAPDGPRFDLGCGSGRLLRPLAAKYPGIPWVGIDSSLAMLTALTQARPRLPNIAEWVGDGRGFGSLAPEFDGGYSVQVFQHLPPDAVRGYLSEIARVLRPGGRFVFQWVPGEVRGLIPDSEHVAPFSWKHSAGMMLGWCKEAGLTWEVPANITNEWAWVTAVK